MDTKRIRHLLDSFPPESSLYLDMGAGIPEGEFHAQVVNRTACALMDPSFPWRYAMALLKIRKRIPAEVYEPYIHHAFEFASADTPRMRRKHPHIVAAKMFHHPTWRYHRGFLEALLLIPGISLNDVAKFTGTDVVTVHCYENLFFNVRDRLNDKLYINQIVYPKTRQVENDDDYRQNEDPGHLMLRAAHNSGLEAVLRIYGTKADLVESKLAIHSRQLKAHVMTHAVHMAETGGLNQAHDPVMKQAFKLMVAAENNLSEDSLMGLTAISLTPGESVLETVAGQLDNSWFEEQLKKQREQMAPVAKTEDGKKDAPKQPDETSPFRAP